MKKIYKLISQRYFLPVILLIFVILSNLNIDYSGELNFLELLQVSTLLLCFILQFKFRRLFIKGSNKFSYFSRLSLFIFLIYEEISFITEGKIELFNELSTQSEVNFHNNKFLFYNFIEFTIPLINKIAVLNGYVLGISVVLTIFGFGSYFKFLKRFKYFFLEKKFALYTQLFLANYLISGVVSSIKPGARFLYGEFFEFLIYIILVLDILEKRKILINKSQQKILD